MCYEALTRHLLVWLFHTMYDEKVDQFIKCKYFLANQDVLVLFSLFDATFNHLSIIASIDGNT